MTACDTCQSEQTGTAYGCPGCARRTTALLAEIATLAPAARAVAARQTRRGPTIGGTGGGDRLVLNLAAAARLDVVTTTITTWVRHVIETRGGNGPEINAHGRAGADGGTPLGAAAQWLTGHVEWFRHRGEWLEFAADVAAAERVLRGVVDGPGERRYAGPCTTRDEETGDLCGVDLYAKPGRDIAVCSTCGYEYDIKARQEWMRDQIEDHLARPVEISGIMLRLGVAIGYSTIAAYVQKGRVVPRGHDEKQRPLFRIGDVLKIKMEAKKPRRVREHPRGMANLREG